MVTVALCPACNEGIDLEAAGEKCPHCGTPLPEQLRSASQIALARRRPVLITVLMVFFFITDTAYYAVPPLTFTALYVVHPRASAAWVRKVPR